MSTNVDRGAKATRSPVFRAFGLGLEPLEFADRVDRLRTEKPEKWALLFDIANRVLFADYLRLEVGWALERSPGGSGEYLRMSENLDALEIYLLCTCIDAVGGSGSREGFRDVFLQLPSSVKDSLADTVVVLKGGWGRDADQLRQRFAGWSRLTADRKVGKLAAEYFWDRRRCTYTHRTHVDPTTSQGLWRRLSQSGELAGVHRGGWSESSVFSANEPDQVRYAVLIRRALDEGFLLRAVVAIGVRSEILKWPAGLGYFQEYIGYHQALGDIHAFLNEMERNQGILDSLSAVELCSASVLRAPHLLPTLGSAAAKRLTEDYGGLSCVLAQYLVSHVSALERVNDHIRTFNACPPGEVTDWTRRMERIRSFCTEPRFVDALGASRWYHQWIQETLRNWVDSGYLVVLFGRGSPHWKAVWKELCRELSELPRCPIHSSLPHVKTLSRGIINDILDISEDGLTVRSHQTLRGRFIPASRFERWWWKLRTSGHANPSAPPATQDSRVVAAVLAAALPHRVCVTDGGILELTS
jgi:hypothetical protein